MIPSATITAMAVVAGASLLLPIITAAVIKIKTKAGLSNYFTGMLVFIVCYIIAGVTSVLFTSAIPGVVLLVVVSSFRAGIVEESGRLLAFSVLLKKRTTIGDALMYGAGHGGTEVMLVLTLTMVSNLILSVTANATASMPYTALAPEQADAMAAAIDALTRLSVSELLWSLAERVSAMLLHISLSVIVFYAARAKKPKLYLLSVLLHALINCGTLLYYLDLTSIAAFEIVLFATVIPVACFARQLGKRYNAYAVQYAEPMPQKKDPDLRY